MSSANQAAPIRVMLAKIGLDGHDRGVKVVARTLRDAGMEVIYTGLHRSPDQVLEAAVQEDVDVLGVSLLSGAHMSIFGKVFGLIAEMPETPRFAIVAGGVMPDEDEAKLRSMAWPRSWARTPRRRRSLNRFVRSRPPSREGVGDGQGHHGAVVVATGLRRTLPTIQRPAVLVPEPGNDASRAAR